MHQLNETLEDAKLKTAETMLLLSSDGGSRQVGHDGSDPGSQPGSVAGPAVTGTLMMPGPNGTVEETSFTH